MKKIPKIPMIIVHDDGVFWRASGQGGLISVTQKKKEVFT